MDWGFVRYDAIASPRMNCPAMNAIEEGGTGANAPWGDFCALGETRLKPITMPKLWGWVDRGAAQRTWPLGHGPANLRSAQ